MACLPPDAEELVRGRLASAEEVLLANGSALLDEEGACSIALLLPMPTAVIKSKDAATAHEHQNLGVQSEEESEGDAPSATDNLDSATSPCFSCCVFVVLEGCLEHYYVASASALSAVSSCIHLSGPPPMPMQPGPGGSAAGARSELTVEYIDLPRETAACREAAAAAAAAAASGELCAGESSDGQLCSPPPTGSQAVDISLSPVQPSPALKPALPGETGSGDAGISRGAGRRRARSTRGVLALLNCCLAPGPSPELDRAESAELTPRAMPQDRAGSTVAGEGGSSSVGGAGACGSEENGQSNTVVAGDVAACGSEENGQSDTVAAGDVAACGSEENGQSDAVAAGGVAACGSEENGQSDTVVAGDVAACGSEENGQSNTVAAGGVAACGSEEDMESRGTLGGGTGTCGAEEDAQSNTLAAVRENKLRSRKVHVPDNWRAQEDESPHSTEVPLPASSPSESATPRAAPTETFSSFINVLSSSGATPAGSRDNPIFFARNIREQWPPRLRTQLTSSVSLPSSSNLDTPISHALVDHPAQSPTKAKELLPDASGCEPSDASGGSREPSDSNGVKSLRTLAATCIQRHARGWLVRHKTPSRPNGASITEQYPGPPTDGPETKAILERLESLDATMSVNSFYDDIEEDVCRCPERIVSRPLPKKYLQGFLLQSQGGLERLVELAETMNDNAQQLLVFAGEEASDDLISVQRVLTTVHTFVVAFASAKSRADILRPVLESFRQSAQPVKPPPKLPPLQLPSPSDDKEKRGPEAPLQTPLSARNWNKGHWRILKQSRVQEEKEAEEEPPPSSLQDAAGDGYVTPRKHTAPNVMVRLPAWPTLLSQRSSSSRCPVEESSLLHALALSPRKDDLRLSDAIEMSGERFRASLPRDQQDGVRRTSSLQVFSHRRAVSFSETPEPQKPFAYASPSEFLSGNLHKLTSHAHEEDRREPHYDASDNGDESNSSGLGDAYEPPHTTLLQRLINHMHNTPVAGGASPLWPSDASGGGI
ncbi:hypothetical protein CYMTET_31419 [Cymbomonas tetramitiformis]|uniref:Uncharacterized protein n=1 Tax=Cymbomonas tetramitiformis TaxID=36881 RepID=A0AAE0KSW5_9CHLO|nr:hypothetical protein CYMTET_31419 [Cymbomonas tetramitiformis]